MNIQNVNRLNNEYVPTPKDDIERRLNEFERQMSYM